MHDHKIRTLLIGDYSVGKTTFGSSITNNRLPIIYTPTIGVDFCTSLYKINDKIVKLHIWDLGGDERFRTIMRSYVNNSQLILLFFSYDDRQSYVNLDYWLQFINENNIDKYYLCLIGTKNDVKYKRREVTAEDIERLDKRFNCNIYSINNLNKKQTSKTSKQILINFMKWSKQNNIVLENVKVVIEDESRWKKFTGCVKSFFSKIKKIFKK